MDSSYKRLTQLPDQLVTAPANPDANTPSPGVIEGIPPHHESSNKAKGNLAHTRQRKYGYLSRKTNSSSPDRQDIDPRSNTIPLRTVEAHKASLRPAEYVMTQHTSPWNSYDGKYELQIEEFITVAVKKTSPGILVTIKAINESSSDEKILMLQSLQHECFSIPRDIFRFEQSLYIVFDYIPVSLFEVVLCPAYPSEEQLAAILGQVSIPDVIHEE